MNSNRKAQIRHASRLFTAYFALLVVGLWLGTETGFWWLLFAPVPGLFVVVELLGVSAASEDCPSCGRPDAAGSLRCRLCGAWNSRENERSGFVLTFLVGLPVTSAVVYLAVVLFAFHGLGYGPVGAALRALLPLSGAFGAWLFILPYGFFCSLLYIALRFGVRQFVELRRDRAVAAGERDT